MKGFQSWQTNFVNSKGDLDINGNLIQRVKYTHHIGELDFTNAAFNIYSE